MELFNKIITKKQIKDLQEKYESQQLEIKRRLHKIQEGTPFGEYDFHDEGSYYPASFMKIIDEETGLIEYMDLTLNKVTRDSVLNLFIEEN